MPDDFWLSAFDDQSRQARMDIIESKNTITAQLLSFHRTRLPQGTNLLGRNHCRYHPGQNCTFITQNTIKERIFQQKQTQMKCKKSE